MNIAEINQLTRVSLNKLTSEDYLAAHNDPTTGKQFAAKVNELENAPRPAATRPAGNTGTPPTPGMSSFDPSYDENPNDGPSAAPVVERARGVRGRTEQPASAQPAAASEPAAQPAAEPGTLLVWEYQPTDSANRPLGGLQRFKYDPTLPNEHPQSLASQLTKSNIHAVRIAKERKIQDVLDGVKRDATAYVEPTLLTVSDHPEYAALNELTRNAVQNATMSALNVFKQNHPEFVLSETNAAAMVGWVSKAGLNPGDAASWERAWKALKPYIGEATSTTDVPVVVATPAEVPAPAPVAAPAVASHTLGAATGLSDADVFNEEPVAVTTKVQGVKIVLDGKVQIVDLKSWDRMPSEQQRRVLKIQSNAQAIDALYNAEVQRRSTAPGARG
jgi:hypothetical protein